MGKNRRIPVIEPEKLTKEQIATLPGQYIIDTINPKKIKILTNAEFAKAKEQISGMTQEMRTKIIQQIVNVNMAAVMLRRDHVKNRGRFLLESEMKYYMAAIESARLEREEREQPVTEVDLTEFMESDVKVKTSQIKPVDLSEFMGEGEEQPKKRGRKKEVLAS